MLCIKIANHVFRINNRYSLIETLSPNYCVEVQDGVDVSVTDKDIEFEKSLVPQTSDNDAEAIAIYRKICEYLLDFDMIMFHSSAIELDGKSYLITAPSGTGKSTHASLWRERFGNRVVMINDDKPLLSVSKNGIFVHGTPYGGKHRLQTNKVSEVCGIIVLYQAAENTICPLSPKDAYPILMNQVYRPNNANGIIKTMDLVKSLAELPIYSLGCNISQEAVTLAYQALTGEDK